MYLILKLIRLKQFKSAQRNKRLFFVVFFIIACGNLNLIGQKNTYKTIINKADKVIVYNTVTKANEDKILLVNKYINVKKNISIKLGSNIEGGFPKYVLERGHNVNLENLIPNNFNFITLKLIDGKLKISIVINGFDDKYVVRIVNNKLVTSKDYHLYASDRYFELFDDYYIPVLQVELIKETNQ